MLVTLPEVMSCLVYLQFPKLKFKKSIHRKSLEGGANDLNICFRGDFGVPSSNLRSKTSKSFTQRPKYRNQIFRKLKIRVFGHNSAPWRRIGTRIGGNSSYKPPGAF